MRLIYFLIVLLLPASLPGGITGNTPEVRLISESKTISAGKTFHLGLHLKHPEGAHTYWKHPGVVGFATKIEWALPPGFKAGEIEWPAPVAVMMSLYQTQGYEGETLLIIPITAPDTLGNGSVTLAAKVSWMSCAKGCEPSMLVPFSISLPVSAGMEADPSTRPLFEKFRALVPRRDPTWKAAVARESDKIVLSIKPPVPVSNTDGIRFFTADGQVDSNQEQRIEILSDGMVRATLIPSETGPENPKTLPGVITIPSDGKTFHLEVEPAY